MHQKPHCSTEIQWDHVFSWGRSPGLHNYSNGSPKQQFTSLKTHYCCGRAWELLAAGENLALHSAERKVMVEGICNKPVSRKRAATQHLGALKCDFSDQQDCSPPQIIHKRRHIQLRPRNSSSSPSRSEEMPIVGATRQGI